MSSRRRKSELSAWRAMEMSIAVPQVVAHRVLRMALAGSNPSARDRREFDRMWSEKLAAFYESWTAMAAEATLTQHKLMLSAIRSTWWPGHPSAWSALRIADDMRNGASVILGKGLAPVQRRAVANAKRLRQK